MKVIVLLGGPGSGKGTAAEGLMSQRPYQHVSTGDMLRAEIAKDSPTGREADVFVSKGELVPDAMATAMVESQLYREGAEDCFMLDGYPRTLAQADIFQDVLGRNEHAVGQVFYLDVREEALIQRLGGRRLCPSCGAGYHVENIPPREEGLCDECGTALVIRNDDTKETIQNRIAVYQKQTGALVSYYETRGLLSRIDASGTPADTNAALDLRMGELGL